MKQYSEPIHLLSAEIIPKYLDRQHLDTFFDLVRAGSAKFNIHSGNLADEDLNLFVAESLLPLQLGWIDLKSDIILDIGSGWGIPAIPLLLSDRDFQFTLVERSRKKASFLSLVLNSLGLSAKIVADDLRNITTADKFRVIICRQVAIDDQTVGIISSHSLPGASLITYGPEIPPALIPKTETIRYIYDSRPVRLINRTQIL